MDIQELKNVIELCSEHGISEFTSSVFSFKFGQQPKRAQKEQSKSASFEELQREASERIKKALLRDAKDDEDLLLWSVDTPEDLEV